MIRSEGYISIMISVMPIQAQMMLIRKTSKTEVNHLNHDVDDTQSSSNAADSKTSKTTTTNDAGSNVNLNLREKQDSSGKVPPVATAHDGKNTPATAQEGRNSKERTGGDMRARSKTRSRRPSPAPRVDCSLSRGMVRWLTHTTLWFRPILPRCFPSHHMIT